MLKNGLEILTIGGVSKKPSGSLDSSQYENSLQFDLKEVQFALDDEDARQQTNGAGYGCSKRDSHDLQHLRGPGYSIRERNMGERRSSHTLREVEPVLVWKAVIWNIFWMPAPNSSLPERTLQKVRRTVRFCSSIARLIMLGSNLKFMAKPVSYWELRSKQRPEDFWPGCATWNWRRMAIGRAPFFCTGARTGGKRGVLSER
jgi:hypothetical protein